MDPATAGGERARAPSLAGAMRRALRAYVDEALAFALANLAWVVLIGVAALLAAIVPLSLVLVAPLLALPTAVLLRLAVATVRDEVPSLRMVRDELGRHAGRKLAIGGVQLVVLMIGVANVVVADAVRSLPTILAGFVSGYALVAMTVIALALWPVVCDPRRDASLGDQLRLALAIVAVRPLQLAVLGLIAALGVVVSVQLVVPAFFLPSLVVLALAAYVVPIADRIRSADDGGGGDG
jgi:hypothetical protein